MTDAPRYHLNERDLIMLSLRGKSDVSRDLIATLYHFIVKVANVEVIPSFSS